METEKGRISIHADETLEITVGDSITLTMNGKSGSVKLEAQKVQIEAGKKLELTTDGKADGVRGNFHLKRIQQRNGYIRGKTD